MIRGESESSKIYEDESIVALMDIKPITIGHVLVTTKKHTEFLTELDDNLSGKLFTIAKKIGFAMKKSKLGCNGVTYLLSEGAAAGQDVFHVHLHVIPRYRSDGFYFHMPEKYESDVDKKEIENAADKIREKLSKM